MYSYVPIILILGRLKSFIKPNIQKNIYDSKLIMKTLHNLFSFQDFGLKSENITELGILAEIFER